MLIDIKKYSGLNGDIANTEINKYYKYMLKHLVETNEIFSQIVFTPITDNKFKYERINFGKTFKF